MFAAIGTALLILPAADLGQREHLLVAAFLPYLVLFARSLGRRQADAAGLASLVGRRSGGTGMRAEAALRRRCSSCWSAWR